MKGTRQAIVIRDFQAAYPDPLSVRAGDRLTPGKRDDEWQGWVWCTNIEGKGGWVPESWLTTVEGGAVIRRDYTAAELTVTRGERLRVHATESGWHWASRADGQRGWVPATHIRLAQPFWEFTPAVLITALGVAAALLGILVWPVGLSRLAELAAAENYSSIAARLLGVPLIVTGIALLLTISLQWVKSGWDARRRRSPHPSLLKPVARPLLFSLLVIAIGIYFLLR